MAFQYTGSTGLFTALGKFVKKVNAYLATGQTTYPADEDEITTVLEGGNFNALIGQTDSAYTAAEGAIVNLRGALASCGTVRLTDLETVAIPLNVTQINTNTILPALIAQMVKDGQTVQQNTVSLGSVTAGGSNIGNGTIIPSLVLDGVDAPVRNGFACPAYNGVASNLPIAETMTITCTNDSYSGNATPGNETFSISGPIGQTSAWGLNPEGTGQGPNVQTAQAGSLLANLNFTQFSGGVPSGWTLTAGTTPANCNQETVNTFLGTSALKLIGDGSTATITLKNAPTTLNNFVPMRRYLFGIWIKASAIATSGQSLTINFTGTGYSPASSEEIVIAGNALPTVWTFYSFWINLPVTLPSNWTLQISVTGTLPNTTIIYFDNAGFGASVYENGIAWSATTGNVPFAKGDTFTVAVNNNYAGVFQTYFRRAYNCQLSASNSPTIPDSLAT